MIPDEFVLICDFASGWSVGPSLQLQLHHFFIPVASSDCEVKE